MRHLTWRELKEEIEDFPKHVLDTEIPVETDENRILYVVALHGFDDCSAVSIQLDR